jgi:hypothetical protein
MIYSLPTIKLFCTPLSPVCPAVEEKKLLIVIIHVDMLLCGNGMPENTGSSSIGGKFVSIFHLDQYAFMLNSKRRTVNHRFP